MRLIIGVAVHFVAFMSPVARLVLLIILLCSEAASQTMPSSLPTLPPTTAPRREAILPPGFNRTEIEGRVFFLEPADESWVRAAVESTSPATMPTTMPADLLDRLAARRQSVAQQMVRDLALSDAKPIDEYIDQRLKVFLQRMDDYRPPLVYLVTSSPRLTEIMKQGWVDPRFHYNRAAAEVQYSTRVSLALDDRGDTVVPLLYAADETPDARQRRIIEEIRGTEGGILDAVSRETLAMTTVGFVELVSSQALTALNLKPDQEWLGVGIAGVLAAIYVADLSGMSAEQLLDGLTQENRGNPIRPATIDLLRPMNLNELRPQMLGAYVDAYRRRAMQAVRVLYDRGGEGAIPKVIAAIRANPPADGPALVTLIQQTTGVDLTDSLRAK